MASIDCTAVDETTPVPLVQAVREWCKVRNAGRPPHTNTITRWVLKGIHGTRLRAIRVGRTWKTSIRWIDEFSEAVNGSYSPVAGREAEADAAAEQLDQMTKPRRRRTAAAS